jgi:DNA-binding LacI/PurR family transcriptional regulator
MKMTLVTPKTSVRLIDIARKVGVSKVAVSKVLHNSAGNRTCVSEETARKIRAVADELDYKPNLTAQQLAGGRSFLIGGILDSDAPENYSKRMFAVERMIAERGYRFLVGYSHNEVDRVVGHIDDFLGRGVDGVICLSHTYPQYGEKIINQLKAFKNCVLIERPIGKVEMSYVAPDYVEVGRLLTEHLLSRGHRRVSLLHFGLEYQTVQDELAGYKLAIEDAGLSFDESLIVKAQIGSATDIDVIRQCVDQLMPSRPDAVITINAGTAIRVIWLLNELGICVPEGCAVASFDSWEIGQFYRPSITSVDLRSSEVGTEAIRMLVEDIENPESVRLIRKKIITPKLVIGDSSGKQYNP